MHSQTPSSRKMDIVGRLPVDLSLHILSMVKLYDLTRYPRVRIILHSILRWMNHLIEFVGL